MVLIEDKKDSLEDIVLVEPAEGLCGEIKMPGDKSISHRAVIIGSIAEGVTEVDGFLEGEDNMSTINAFRLMGVEITRPGHNKLLIKGRGLKGPREPSNVIDAGNSGTTARLLIGLLSAQDFFSVITGDGSLRSRPMKRVVEPLRKMGASITGRSDGEFLPLAITGQKLKGIHYKTPVASAQLKSALLLAGLYAEGQTVIEEPLGSRDHTEKMLRSFGAEITVNAGSIRITGKRPLKARSVTVPGDISSAAFFIVGASMTPRSELLIKNAGINPTRTGVIDILKKMGARIEILNPRETDGEPISEILVKSSQLKGIKITGEELVPAIDEFPVVCVAAAFAEGKTTIEGASELRVKESDRVASMAEGLAALGVNVQESPDGITIEGQGPTGLLKGGRVSSKGDHRIAMAMAVAGLRSTEGVTIDGAGCVDISFPEFFRLLSMIKV